MLIKFPALCAHNVSVFYNICCRRKPEPPRGYWFCGMKTHFGWTLTVTVIPCQYQSMKTITTIMYAYTVAGLEIWGEMHSYPDCVKLLYWDVNRQVKVGGDSSCLLLTKNIYITPGGSTATYSSPSIARPVLGSADVALCCSDNLWLSIIICCWEIRKTVQ